MWEVVALVNVETENRGRSVVLGAGQAKQRVTFMNGVKRSDIKAGLRVMIVRKQDQRTGRLTE